MTNAATVAVATPLPCRFTLADGRRLCLRRLAPSDMALLVEGYARQTATARRARFLCAANGAAAARLLALLQAPRERQTALALVHEDEAGGEHFVAEAGYVVADGGASAEFALLVDGRWQHLGLGQRLLAALVEAATRQGLTRLHGLTLADNASMQALARRCGFAVLPRRDGECADLELALPAGGPAPRGWFAALRWLFAPAAIAA